MQAIALNVCQRPFVQGYHGCAIGKGKQSAKTEIEKLKVKTEGRPPCVTVNYILVTAEGAIL